MGLFRKKPKEAKPTYDELIKTSIIQSGEISIGGVPSFRSSTFRSVSEMQNRPLPSVTDSLQLIISSETG